MEAYRRGDLAEAAIGFRESLSEQPLAANYNLGQALRILGDLAGAEAAYRRALEVAPTTQQAAYRLGEICLATGRFSEGWPLWEKRRGVDSTVIEPPTRFKQLTCPEWCGEDLTDKHVLVFGDQGYGDRLMFARYLSKLRNTGARCTFIVPNNMAALFEEGQVAGGGLPFADFWVLASSLPFKLGLGVPPPPYPLQATPRPWHSRVGVVPTGNPGHPNDANRSLFGNDCAALLKLGADLRPEATGARTFLETAAIISGLDLVITVDTSVAHLAASLGKPTWILLPAIGTDWRWMREREDSPWYPSARLLRQAAPGCWTDVLERVEAELMLRGLR